MWEIKLMWHQILCFVLHFFVFFLSIQFFSFSCWCCICFLVCVAHIRATNVSNFLYVHTYVSFKYKNSRKEIISLEISFTISFRLSILLYMYMRPMYEGSCMTVCVGLCEIVLTCIFIRWHISYVMWQELFSFLLRNHVFIF